MAINDPFKPAAPAAAAAPKITRPRINDPFAQPAAITRPKPPESPGFGGSFVRGLKRSVPETLGLLHGAAAAVAGAVGAEGARDRNLAEYGRIQRESVEPLASSSTFAGSVKGDTSLREWAGDTLGNFAGQALQSGAAALAGGAVGSAGGPVGGVAGAVGGALARGAVKKAVEGEVARMLIRRPVAEGVAREAAEAGARRAVLGRLGGAAAASTGLNVAQETGIGFAGRAEDAAAAGEKLTPADSARAIAFGVPAGLVDTAAEGLVAGRLMRGVSSNPSLLKRVGAGAAVGAATEGATEGVQAVLERAGAARELTGSEATADYIENIAAGALGGGVAGGPSGLRRIQRPVLPADAPQIAQQAVRRITQQPADPIEVDAGGVATTGLQRHEQRQELIGQGMDLRDTGQTGDVRRARTQHPGYTRDGMPIITRPVQHFPNAAPGSLSDAGNSLPKRPRQPNTFDGATQQLLSSEPPPGGTQGEPKPFSSTPVVPPWVDRSTGEILPATPELLKEAVRQQMLSQYEQDGTMRMAPLQLAQSWGVRASEVKSARAALLQESAAARRLGMPDPLDTTQRQAQQVEPSSAGDAGQAQAAPAGPISGAAALLPSAPAPPAAEPFAQQPAQSAASAPRPTQASSSPTPVERTYDESPDVLDTDITPSWGAAYTQQQAAELAARRQGGGAKAVPVDGGFVVRMPIPAAPEPANERAGAEPTGAGSVAPGGGGVAPAPAALDAAGTPAVPAATPEVAPGQHVAPPLGGTAAPAPPAQSVAAAPAAPESTLRGRLERFRTPAGEELVRFRQRNASGFARVRRADLDNAALPVLPLYNSSGAKMASGLGSTVRRRDLVNIAPLRGVPDAQQGWVSPAAAGTTAPMGAQQQESVDVEGQQQGEASNIDAQPTQPEPPIGDANSPAPGVPALGNTADPPERRADSAQRAAIDALPQDEKDIEIQRLRTELASAQQQLDTDPLTGVRSRAAYERDKAAAGGVATVDIKLFKGYNTVGGQTGGDIVLRAFGAAMRDIEGDVRAYRPGGDEFALLGDSPEAVAAAAARLETAAANIYTTLEKDGVRFEVNGVPFTAGIGTDEQSADADLSSRKGDYDRNALPESIRRADQDQLGAGRAADEGRGADNVGGVPPSEAADGGLSDESGARSDGEPAAQRRREDSAVDGPAAGGSRRARAQGGQNDAADAGLRAPDDGRLEASGGARNRVPDPEAAERVAPATEQTPETPAQAGVSASGLSVSELLRGATRNTRLQGAVTDPVAADVLTALGKGGAAELDQALAERGVRPRAVLAGGAGSIVLDAGERVVRLGRGDGKRPERMRSALVLQAEASGTAGNARWEVLPKVETAGITEADVATMQEQLRSAGLEFVDPGTDNLGRRENGDLVVIDAGAVRPARSTIDAAAAAAATSPANERPEPSEAQREAGNYAKGHVRLHGLDISIENPAGTSRRPEWPPLKNHYGYIRRTEGADGDHVDVFLGPGAENADLPVFVIDQVDPKSRKFDEHKVILGAATGREARRIYQANYAPDWKGFGAITPMPLPQFKAWLQGDTSKPANPSIAPPARKPSFSKPSPELPQVETQAFKRWFGDSKVVDGNGKPLVVYHETDSKFTEFRIADGKRAESDGEMPTGAFFKPESRGIGVAKDATRQMPVWLSIRNPLVVADREALVQIYSNRIPGYAGLADKEGEINRRWKADPRTDWAVSGEEKQRVFKAAVAQWESELASVANTQKTMINAWFATQPYDGLIVERDVGSLGRSTKTFVAFRPEQIKSAIGNTGAFDPSNPDIRFSRPPATPPGGLSEGVARDAAMAIQKDWGPAGPRVRVLADAEQLPRAAKTDPDYKTAEGYYDGQTVFLIAPNLRSAERVQQVLAHEAIGHYGVDRIVDEHVEGGWAKLSGDIDRLRKDRSLGSKDMRAVLNAVERRYPGADTDTFARETLAVMAEKDVRNGLISRAMAAIKAWLRKFIPGYNPTEKQLRGLLDKSHQLLRAGPNYAQRAAAMQSMSFSQKAPPFYSAMVESVRKAQGAPKSGTAAQWKGWLDGAQRRGEFKQSERDWMGVDQWLDEQAGPVSRDQLNAFVDANAVSLGEALYATPVTTWTQSDQDRWAELTDNFLQLGAADRAELDELNRRSLYGDRVEAGGPGAPRFSNYTIGGGANYRELLMTLPLSAAGPNFETHHFPDVKNILVHVRFNERTDTAGKRVLHVEEIQSDWHQVGRKKGYGDVSDAEKLHAVEVRPGQWEVRHGDGIATDGTIFSSQEAAAEAAAADNENWRIIRGTVPNAPLRKTEDWALLGMKRAIRWAAENGFERVTWTTGRQQANRYDLGAAITDVYWSEVDPRTGRKRVGVAGPSLHLKFYVGSDGRIDVSEKGTGSDQFHERPIDEVVGKEIAEKILADGNKGRLTGTELRIGGDGMKAFYDQMLPKAVAGYVKKWGGKVGTTTIETGQSDLADSGDLVPERLTVHSLDLTPAMVDSAMRGQPLFSKPDASVNALDQVLAQPDGGAWQRAKEWMAGKWQDFQPTALGALTLRHVLELAESLLPGAKRYADLVQQIGADRNIMLEKAGALSDRLQKWARGGRLFGGYTAEARALFDLIHKSTIEGSDPSKPYEVLHFEDSRGRPVPFSAEAVKERIKQLKAQIKGRPGDAMAEQNEQLKFLERLPAIEKSRREGYPRLVAAWQQLTPEAQKYYAELRDSYVEHSNEVEKALVKRVEALDVPEEKKRALAAKIRYQFETQRLQGVYFPLQRFGEFWVSATDKDGEHAYLMFENAKEWTRAQAKLRGAGFTITATGRKDQNYSAKDAPSGTFVADVIRELQSAHVTEKVQDQVYQLFLKSLPELSMRKHSIHRKATAGFSDDAARAFAKNAFHGAHQLSRLRYAHELQSTLEAMRVLADNRRKEGLPAAEVNAMDALLGEMARRHDWIMSPTDSKVANYASAIGFAYYLGVTPAAALVNLTQGALTTFPVLGAQHGFDKAGRMLSAATRDAMRTWGNIDRVLQSDEERAAFKTLLERGDIQRTAAHNLAGIAEGSDLQANPIWAKTMHGISYVFQKMEEINRQAAGIAAFRMARSAGQDFNAAVKYASEIINRTHYDFSNANRARFMQSAPAKVLLMFRQYALNTSWLLGRATYKAFAGESPEVKREARRTLAGVLGMSALFSGAMGLPFMGIASTVANAIQAAFGDDDEPWDFNTEVRNFLAGMLGPEAARWVADGAVNRAGADVASRVSMSQMWFRDADRELEGQDAYYNLLEQAAGPMGGIVKNLLVGKKQVDDGHVWRGIETMMPKAIKDAMKSLRFADEGANTLRGDPILEDVTTAEKFVQLMGFSPTRLGEQYRVNRAVKNYEQHVLDRRASLLSALALSVRLKDEEMRAAAVEKIQAFNRAHPEIALTQKGIAQSLRARARYSREAENGIVLNKRLAERARESVEFAD